MGKQSEKKISANRTKIIITVLLVVTFVALAVTIWALFFRNTGPALVIYVLVQSHGCKDSSPSTPISLPVQNSF